MFFIRSKWGFVKKNHKNRKSLAILRSLLRSAYKTVHRLFHDGAWPGDLDADGCRAMIRRLMAIQLWLQRARRQIWLIFERAGFVELSHTEDGILAMNIEIYDLLDVNDD